MQHTVVFHICSSALWAEAKHSEYYRCPSLESEGFIHCSTPDQVVEVVNYVFRGNRGLILLAIDPDQVIQPIQYEDAGNGKLYPYIYGPLNPSAVIAVDGFQTKRTRKSFVAKERSRSRLRVGPAQELNALD